MDLENEEKIAILKTLDFQKLNIIAIATNLNRYLTSFYEWDETFYEFFIQNGFEKFSYTDFFDYSLQMDDVYINRLNQTRHTSINIELVPYELV